MKKLLKQNLWFLLILFFATLFIIFGVYRGEILTVWQNASAICLECIGIG